MQIIKRDGRRVDFDGQKIMDAILEAFISVDEKVSEYAEIKAYNIAEYIENLSEEKELTIDEIQNLVEKGLMSTKRKDVAKAYMLYRAERDKRRARNTTLRKNVVKKLKASNIQNQNANVDEQSFGGRMGEANSEQMRTIALDDIISEMARRNHLGNIVYIHDLDTYPVGMHNCLSIPFDLLLAKGFNTRQTDVRPANSVNTAFQLVAVIFQLQSLQQFGGVSATHLDWTMVPYVRKSFYKHWNDAKKYIKNPSIQAIGGKGDFSPIDHDHPENTSINNWSYRYYIEWYEYAMDMTIRETQQAVEGMYHNLNTLQSRSGNQLPFTSINYGTCTLPEGRMVIEALLKGSLKGVGKLHKTSIFPCGIFQYMKGVNDKPGTPNYDLKLLALESTAKRLYPNYANVDWSGNAGYDPEDPTTYFSTMGCRTANGWDINGMGQTKDGRGNICPVTIIMPTIAMIAKERANAKYVELNMTEDKEKYTCKIFLQLLNEKIHEAKDMLIERFDWICEQSPASAKFMYENNVMAGYVPEEGIRSALKHGTLAIGQIGLAETLQILVGCDHTEEKGMKFAKQIEQLFKDKCAQFKEEYKLNFGVYYTPAENLCHTALKKFRDKYGVIENVSDKEFFTNSTHVPVWKEIDPFTKIDIESQLTGYSSAGCITYVELDAGCKNNLEALETLVNYAMDKDIPYFAINVPNDTCMKCGYTDELNDDCPMCGGEDIQRLRRVTGYLTGNYTTAFNKGKQQEVEMRVKHDKYGGFAR
jgi:ribonucleoside-triphosphate reductase